MPLIYNICPPSSTGVIQNGLIINLDASYNSSYPKTGTTWTNIAQNAYDFTLTNGPEFQLVNQGVINFSGDDEFALVGNTDSGGVPGGLQNYTVNTWFNFNTLPAVGQFTAIFTQQLLPVFPFTRDINFAIGTLLASTPSNNNRIYGGYFVSSAVSWRTVGGFQPVVNTWYNMCITYDSVNKLRLYLDGELTDTDSNTLPATLSPTTGPGYYIARRWDGEDYVDAKIPVVNLYDRALTAEEVSFTYETLKGRFT